VFTVSLSAADVDAAKSKFPEYAAVRLSDPAGKLVVEKVATPDEFRVPLPSRVPPL
jgi:hypothetical protein